MRPNDVDVIIAIAFAYRGFNKMNVRLYAIIYLHVRNLQHGLRRTFVRFEELNDVIC